MKALKKYPVTPDRIYNIDETGVSTVVDPPKVVAQKGIRQVGHNASAERSQMITACMTINAVGQSLPPVFIFPRVRMSDILIIGVPERLNTLKNILDVSTEDKILLFMDNHESHCSLEAVSYAKEKGIVLVTFPPHCTHKLQPLDVGVFDPFKTKLKIAQKDWLTNNPGKTIRIHDLPSLTKIAFVESFSVKTIVNAFAKPGIWPFSRLAFSDDDFSAAYVTDRPDPNSTQTENLQTQPRYYTEIYSSIHEEVISPEHVRPFPKAAPRIEKKGGRKKGKATILTETPENNRRLFIFESETEENDAIMILLNDNSDTENLNCPVQFGDFVLVKKIGDIFYYPDEQDVDNISQSFIEKILPKPKSVGGGERSALL
ncbi:tigger transposable element-derived protein 6-like, partial [Aphis craccivora]